MRFPLQRVASAGRSNQPRLCSGGVFPIEIPSSLPDLAASPSTGSGRTAPPALAEQLRELVVPISDYPQAIFKGGKAT